MGVLQLNILNAVRLTQVFVIYAFNGNWISNKYEFHLVEKPLYLYIFRLE